MLAAPVPWPLINRCPEHTTTSQGCGSPILILIVCKTGNLTTTFYLLSWLCAIPGCNRRDWRMTLFFHFAGLLRVVKPYKPAGWLHQAFLGYKGEGAPVLFPLCWICDLHVNTLTNPMLICCANVAPTQTVFCQQGNLIPPTILPAGHQHYINFYWSTSTKIVLLMRLIQVQFHVCCKAINAQ